MGGGTRCKLFTDRNRDSRVAVAPEDRMVEHKEALEKHLARRRKDLFGASFDVLLLRSALHLF
jgi:hypothetical protein